MLFKLKKFTSTRNEIRIVNILHFFQFFLIVGVLALGLYRMFNKSIQRTSSSRWAVSVAAKSIIILQYQILTTHFAAFKRFRSLKAFMILNIIEQIFWGAMVGLSAMPFIKGDGCIGIACTISYVLIALGAVLFVLATPIAYISLRQFYAFKETGLLPEEEAARETARKSVNSSVENGLYMKETS